MLKIYEYKLKVYVNGRYIGGNRKLKLEEEHPVNREIILSAADWQTTYDFIKEKKWDYQIGIGQTFFGKRPYIWTGSFTFDTTNYMSNEEFKCDIYYDVRECNESLNFILNYEDSNLAIRYLKERGLSVCPVAK